MEVTFFGGLSTEEIAGARGGFRQNLRATGNSQTAGQAEQNFQHYKVKSIRYRLFKTGTHENPAESREAQLQSPLALQY